MTRSLINRALAAMLLLAGIVGTASAKPPRHPTTTATRRASRPRQPASRTVPPSLLSQPKTWPSHGPQTGSSRPVVGQPNDRPMTGTSHPTSGSQRPIYRPPSPPLQPRTPPSMNTDGRRPILFMDENAPRRRPIAAPPQNGNVRPAFPRPAPPARGSGRLTINENAPRSRPIANPLRVGNGALNPSRPSVGQGDGRFGSPRAGGRQHNGIDLIAPAGTSVHPVAPGRVIFSGPRGRREGNEVKVYHPADRTTSVYMHLNGQQKPRTGTRVTPNSVIGQVGRSGNVPPRADSHLHLSVFDNDGDPMVPNIESRPHAPH